MTQGVGELRDTVWVGVCLIAAAAGPDQAWWTALVVVACALAAGLVSRWSRALAAALLAIGAAPLWGSVTAAMGAPAVGLALLGLALLVSSGWAGLPQAMPRAVPWLVAAVGVVEAGRIALIGGEVAGISSLAGPVLFAGLAVGGCTASAHPRRLLLVGLAASGAVLGLRARAVALTPPETPEQAVAVVRSGLGAGRLDALIASPNLGAAALAADPTWHALALPLLDGHGADFVLDAGWAPVGAPLLPAQRLDVAASLDARGRGGEALRLLWRGRDHPEIAWQASLLARVQGEDAAAERLGARALAAPAEIPHLPGRVDLDITFYVDGSSVVDLQLDRPVASMWMELRGSQLDGPAVLEVTVDAQKPRRITAREQVARVEIAEELEAGPHRVVLRFDNDRFGPGGDRNVSVDALGATP